MIKLRAWWDLVKEVGEKYGYYVKPSKSYLILKDSSKLQDAKQLFESSPINISVDGKRHLGAAIGSNEFKCNYVSDLVSDWCKRLKNLTKIAKAQPHVAYAAFIHGEQHKYTYFLRTLDGLSDTLKPLDDVLEHEFLPTLFGTTVNAETRMLLELPVREGGLGLLKYSTSAPKSFNSSIVQTAPLVDSILSQDGTLPKKEDVKAAKSEATKLHTSSLTTLKTNILDGSTPEKKRSIEQNCEPGVSSWLGALPIKSEGLSLSKSEFQDALCLRYDIKLKSLPAKCVCMADFDLNHALNCHRGGFVNVRHDSLKNFTGALIEKVCHDVEVEPHLEPVPENMIFNRTTNRSDDARADIRARGFWRPGQNSFFDICVTNTESNSYNKRAVSAILRSKENSKKSQYNQRIMNVDHGTFTPLVFSVRGVMGHECLKFYKSLAQKLAEKSGEKYDDIIKYIRVKVSLLSLRSSLLCVRGTRKCTKNNSPSTDEGIDFGLKLNYIMNWARLFKACLNLC